MDSDLESLASSSNDDDNSDDAWSNVEDEDNPEEAAIDLEAFEERPPPLVPQTLPSEPVASSSQPSSSAAKDTNDESNNNNQGRPSWKGKTLYPPSDRNVSNPSIVWKLAGFIKESGKLQLSQAIWRRDLFHQMTILCSGGAETRTCIH